MIRNRLFYDIETSFCKGHFWRPGYNQRIVPEQITDYAKIISIHWKWENENKIHNLDWGLNNQCDKKLIKSFIPLMDKADEIITHNGKRFDTPWIRTRAMFHNIEMRHAYNEIDTYKLCKKYLNLPSNSLKEVCKYYGLPLKVDVGGLDTWVKTIYHKDAEALKHLLYYGDGDITSLEAVFNKIKKYVSPNLQYAVLRGGEKFECPECGNLGRLRKTHTTASGTIQHYFSCRNESCITSYKISNKTYMDYLQHKMINNIK